MNSTLKPCPDCGERHLQELPEIIPEHFTRARELADHVWRESGGCVSVIGLTAALLTKRIGVTIRIPLDALHSMARLYLEVAHEIIASRRAEQRAAKDAN